MNVQIITQNNKPAFAVIPYSEYEELLSRVQQKINDDLLIPQEIIDYKYDNNCSLVKAWRVYLGKTQKEVAEGLGITQGAYSQIEKTENNQKATLKKIAKIFDVEVEQLTLED